MSDLAQRNCAVMQTPLSFNNDGDAAKEFDEKIVPAEYAVVPLRQDF